MTFDTVSVEIKLAIAAVVIALAFCAGLAVDGWRKDAEISKLKETVQADKARAAGETLVRVASANKRGDQAELTLAAWQQTLATYAQEKTNEIARLTTGRRCLDSGVVSLLNKSVPGLNGAVSQAPGLSLRADGGAAARTDDGAYSTDADVAGWIGLCQRSYATCRSRLQLIADFYAGEESPTAQTKAGDSAGFCADCGI